MFIFILGFMLVKSCQRAEPYLYGRAAASHCIILVPDPKTQSVRKVLCVPLRPPQRLPTGGPHPSPLRNERRPAVDGSSAGWLKEVHVVRAPTWQTKSPKFTAVIGWQTDLLPKFKPKTCWRVERNTAHSRQSKQDSFSQRSMVPALAKKTRKSSR